MHCLCALCVIFNSQKKNGLLSLSTCLKTLSFKVAVPAYAQSLRVAYTQSHF